MTADSYPILYAFRRCPYVMRTRIVLSYSNISYILRGIELKNKPSSMLEITEKATVPVMQFPDGNVLDNSLDIIYYALEKNDPEHWFDLPTEEKDKIRNLIALYDTEFVYLLNRYKYFEKHPEKTQEEYRENIETDFLVEMNSLLESQSYIMSDNISLADIAIFPLMRQFAFADKEWFFNSEYGNIIRWIESFLEHSIFKQIMEKHPIWQEGESGILINGG